MSLQSIPNTQREFDRTAILLHATDSVAVIKDWVKAGDELVKGSFSLRAAQDIGPGHKIAVREIAADAPVRKYGHVIGFALDRIAPGQHVHTHNLVKKRLCRDRLRAMLGP